MIINGATAKHGRWSSERAGSAGLALWFVMRSIPHRDGLRRHLPPGHAPTRDGRFRERNSVRALAILLKVVHVFWYIYFVR